jgi:hypothetical protein
MFPHATRSCDNRSLSRLSATARLWGPVAQWSELAAHNRLVGGSSPPGPTTRSSVCGDFLNRRRMPAIGGLLCSAKISVRAGGESQGRFGGLSLALKICVSRKPETWFAETRFEIPSNAKGGRASCAAPTIPPAGRRVEHPHAVRECAIERGFDEIGGEESQRNCHTHLSLDKDAPISRSVEVAGRICGRPILGGLHHQYVRI